MKYQLAPPRPGETLYIEYASALRGRYSRPPVMHPYAAHMARLGATVTTNQFWDEDLVLDSTLLVNIGRLIRSALRHRYDFVAVTLPDDLIPEAVAHLDEIATSSGTLATIEPPAGYRNHYRLHITFRKPDEPIQNA